MSHICKETKEGIKSIKKYQKQVKQQNALTKDSRI